jgi:hypothetical protein
MRPSVVFPRRGDKAPCQPVELGEQEWIVQLFAVRLVAGMLAIWMWPMIGIISRSHC